MNDAFGASPGKMDDLSANGLMNDFATIPNNNIEGWMENDRVQPRQVATGVTRGTWRINNTDGSYITLGEIPNSDGEFGIAFFDSDNNIVSKNLGPSQTIYGGDQEELVKVNSTGFLFSDSTDRRIKIGTSPDDGRVGIWTTEPGIDVIEELGGV